SIANFCSKVRRRRVCFWTGIESTSMTPSFWDYTCPNLKGRTATGIRDLPDGRFHDCNADAFENPAKTTNDILALQLPLGTRVILTILKKIYAQRGRGRRESAIYRGLDTRAQQLVPDALALLKKEGFVTKSKQGMHDIWLPTKSADARSRALKMLATPNTSEDPVLKQSRNFG
ncbi:MAG: hypothetical protein ACREJQ_03435, partial [bacterium]